MKEYKKRIFAVILTIFILITMGCDNKDRTLEKAYNLCVKKYNIEEDIASFTLEGILHNDEIIYLLRHHDYNFWADEIYQLFFDKNGKLEDIISRGGGNTEFLEYNIISLSQGEFLTVCNANHQGNGTIDYYSLNEKGECLYSIPAIDYYFEDHPQLALEYGITNEYDDDIRASEVYKDGKLMPIYEDINNDGNTDILLIGIKQIFANEKETINDADFFGQLYKSFFCVKAYLFNVRTNTFEYSDDYSHQNAIE